MAGHRWQEQAACKGCTELFFPDKGDMKSTFEAKKVCATCPVRVECLEFALENGETVGIWGGMGGAALEEERNRRRRAQVSDPDDARHRMTVDEIESALDRVRTEIVRTDDAFLLERVAIETMSRDELLLLGPVRA